MIIGQGIKTINSKSTDNVHPLGVNELKDILEFATRMAKSAGNHQLKYFGNISNIGTKSTNIDLITKADIESEKIIIKQSSFTDGICDLISFVQSKIH